MKLYEIFNRKSGSTDRFILLVSLLLVSCSVISFVQKKIEIRYKNQCNLKVISKL